MALEKPETCSAHLLVEVSGVCNMRCPMCCYPYIRRSKGFMDFALWQKIVDDAAANGHQIEWLHSFGEPLLWPHLVEGIAYLTSKGLAANISTNGKALTGELAARLAAAGQKQIMVALDTLQPAAYAQLRSGADLALIKRNMHEALQAAPALKIVAQFMYSRYNQDERVDDFYREFGRPANFEVMNWLVIRMTPEAANVSRNLFHSPDQIDKRLCNKLFEHVVVLWDGRTCLCCLDGEGEMITGDLNKNSIAYSFTGPRAMEFRRRILRGEWQSLPLCKRCLADHLVFQFQGVLDGCWISDPPQPLPALQAELLTVIEEGLALDAQGDQEGAFHSFQKVLELNPSLASAHFNLGRALNAKGDLAGAIRSYQMALGSNPRLAEAHSNLGLALMAKGDLESAIHSCQKALEINPQLAEAHGNLGLALKAKGDLAGAIRSFQKALEINPALAGARLNLGTTLCLKGDFESAIRSFQKVLEINPALAGAHLNMGIALNAKGDFEGAIRSLRKALEINPQYAEAQRGLSIALRAKEVNSQAREH